MNLQEDIIFPVSWSYKIIVYSDYLSALHEISDVLKSNGVDNLPKAGNQSKNGKYLTYNVDVIFRSKEEMEKISTELGQLDCVKFLL